MRITNDINPVARSIADLLVSIPKGNSVTFDQISTAAGLDIRTKWYLVYSAMRLAEKESGALFASIFRVGYRRLTSDEIYKIGQTARGSVRKKMIRQIGSMRAGMSHANDVSPEHQRRINQEITSLGLIHFLARDRNIPKIPEGTGRPSVATTSKEFLERINSAFQ